MADISMCNDEACPSFEKCYRAQAPQTPYRQAFFMTSPRNIDGTCEYFWAISPKPYDDE